MRQETETNLVNSAPQIQSLDPSSANDIGLSDSAFESVNDTNWSERALEQIDALTLTDDVCSALRSVIDLLPDDIGIVDTVVDALKAFTSVSFDCGFKV